MGNLFIFLIAIITIIFLTVVDGRNYTRKRFSNFPLPPTPRAPRRSASFPSQGQPRGQPQGQPRGQPQGQPRGQPQGQPRGPPQGQPRGQPQGQPQGQPRGQPQGQPRARRMPPALYDPYRKRELVIDLSGGEPALVPLAEERSLKRSKSLLEAASSSSGSSASSATPGENFYGRSGNEQFGNSHMTMEDLKNALNQKFSYPAAGVSSDPGVLTLQQYLDLGLGYDQIKDKRLSLAERQRLEELKPQLTAPPPQVFNGDQYYPFATQ